VRLTYLRYSALDREPFGAVMMLDDGRVGWSLCCPRDQFRKALARRIAEGRAKAYADSFDTLSDVGARIAWAKRNDTDEREACTSRLEAVRDVIQRYRKGAEE